MSYITDRKRKPPLTQVQLDLMELLSIAQTLGARRALALAVRDGKFDDGRKLNVHWMLVKDAKQRYEEKRDALMKQLTPSQK